MHIGESRRFTKLATERLAEAGQVQRILLIGSINMWNRLQVACAPNFRRRCGIVRTEEALGRGMPV
jgi:hypothetical protein